MGSNLAMRVEHSLMKLLPLQEAAKELPNSFCDIRTKRGGGGGGWGRLLVNQDETTIKKPTMLELQL